MKPNIGVSDNDRAGVVEILNTLLSDENLLYIKTRNYHWNVVGPNFNDFHQLFEQQYDKLEEIVDEVAERARALGGHALGTVSEFLEKSRLKELPGEYPDDRTMLANLLADHETIIQHLRLDARTCSTEFDDTVTGEFLSEMTPVHEKTAWMLRSLLEQ